MKMKKWSYIAVGIVAALSLTGCAERVDDSSNKSRLYRLWPTIWFLHEGQI